VGAYNFDSLVAHKGHKIEIVTYGKENVAVECVDCNEVLFDMNYRQPIACAMW
jgi:hypothetical protein